jgi:protein TonB
MKLRDRIYFLLAAGISLGVHAMAAVYLSTISPDGLNKPPTQIVQISLVAQRPVTPSAAPAPAPEAAPPPVKREPPRRKPQPRPLPPRAQPERTPPPTPEPETVASLPQEPVTPPARPENTEVQQAAASAATSSAQESYLARLLAHIDSHKFYPRGARRRGQEGDVHVMFYLLQDGGIRALEVSGASRQLREAAQRAVQAALPMPLPPASIDLHKQVSFSMQFRLKG